VTGGLPARSGLLAAGDDLERLAPGGRWRAGWFPTSTCSPP